MLLTLLPVKPFSEAKTRLSPLLTADLRRNLSYMLFQRTLHVVSQFSPTLVISRSAEVLHLAHTAAAFGLPERTSGLNLALQQGAIWATQHGYSRLLILPIDLPYLTLDSLQNLHSHPAAVVIAPCQREQGTNALLLSPPMALTPQFGPQSFTRHCTQAEQAGLSLTIVKSPALAFDLDTPSDWYHWAHSFSPLIDFSLPHFMDLMS